jgi:hypothetical protein
MQRKLKAEMRILCVPRVLCVIHFHPIPRALVEPARTEV